MKNTKKMKTVFLTLLLVVVTSLQAQTAKIDDVWVDHNITQNGQLGMIIHSKFSVQSMMNKQGNFIIWFYNEDESPIKGYDQQKYVNTSGYLAVYEKFTPNYARTSFNDFKLFFPYDNLKKSLGAENGRYNLKYRVNVYDENNNSIASSKFGSFIYTIGNNSNSGNPYASPVGQNIEQAKITGGAHFYDADKVVVQTLKGKVLENITSTEMGSIDAPNLYTFRTEDGEIINVSFKNAITSSGSYQLTGSYKTAYYRGVKSVTSVFYITSYKKM